MDRDSLALMLAQGLSLAEIGRRFGRDESTVGYWVKKHGLTAVNAGKHAGRGGLPREQLATLVDAGLSIRQIAAQTGFSPTAVRHWLLQYGLVTRRAHRLGEGREALAQRLPEAELDCAVHGRTTFRLEGRGAYRCLRCRKERVSGRRREIKAILVSEAGGACVVCGYNRCISALQFHHRDPAMKLFAISKEGSTRSLAAARAEAEKCSLVCANCHAELEAGLQTLERAADRVKAA